MVRSLLLWVALCLLAGASAQFPEAPSFESEISITPTTVTVLAGGSLEFTVTVADRTANNDLVSGTAQVEVGSLPAGWTAGLAEESFTVPPGGQATTTLRVTSPESDTSETVTVTVSATVTYGQDPLSQEADAGSASATIETELEGYDALNEQLGGYLPWLAGAGVLLLFGIIAVAATKRAGLSLAVPQVHIDAPAGSLVDLPLTITNKGSRPDRVTLAAGSLPKGWEVQFEQDTVQVPGRGSARVEVQILVPKSAEGRVMVPLAAHSATTNRHQDLFLTVDTGS